MYCTNCGFILKKGSYFCERCGKKIEETKDIKIKNEGIITEKGPWKGFAKAAFPISIVCIVFSFLPIYGMMPLFYGFVFSGLGLYSKVEKEKAKKSMKNCIIGAIIQTSIYFLILFICIMAIL